MSPRAIIRGRDDGAELLGTDLLPSIVQIEVNIKHILSCKKTFKVNL